MDRGDAKAIRGPADGGRGHGREENTDKQASPATDGFRVARCAHARFSSEFTTAPQALHGYLHFPGEENEAQKG